MCEKYATRGLGLFQRRHMFLLYCSSHSGSERDTTYMAYLYPLIDPLLYTCFIQPFSTRRVWPALGIGSTLFSMIILHKFSTEVCSSIMVLSLFETIVPNVEPYSIKSIHTILSLYFSPVLVANAVLRVSERGLEKCK